MLDKWEQKKKTMVKEKLCLIVSKITEMDAIRKDGIDFRGFGVRDVRKDGGLSTIRKAVSGVTRSQILDQFEAVMIALSEPKLNLQRGNLKDYATQYSQWYDPKLYE